tara:strand:+ start:134 stop:724 length:591 start_codon:yes stop_codon:yes gene_type:complete
MVVKSRKLITVKNKTVKNKTVKNKTVKNKTVKNNPKIKKMVNIFKQYYPDIFPRGYFRFLEGNLQEKIKNKEIIFKNGVILTWKIYKKVPTQYKKLGLTPDDIKINQLVNKNQGNGAAKKIFLSFLKKHKNKVLMLDVRSNNKKAIRFYKKNGFKTVAKTKFKDLPGIIMKKSPKKNKTIKIHKTIKLRKIKKGGS